MRESCKLDLINSAMTLAVKTIIGICELVADGAFA